MKTFFILLIAFSFVDVGLLHAYKNCLRCRGEVVCEGDYKSRLFAICGYPDHFEEIGKKTSGISSKRTGKVNIIEEKVERYVYDCGSGRLIYEILVIGGVIDNIGHQGRYGSGPAKCE